MAHDAVLTVGMQVPAETRDTFITAIELEHICQGWAVQGNRIKRGWHFNVQRPWANDE